MSELAKCPVCGSDDVSVSWDADSQDYAVECSTDSSPWHYKVAGCGPEGAIAAHNTLARHAEIGRLVEALANNRDGIVGLTIVDLGDRFSVENPGSEHEAPTLVEALRLMAAARLDDETKGENR